PEGAHVSFPAVRKAFALCLLWLFALSASSHADAPMRQRLIRYFGGWYSYLPGSRVSATETREVVVPELESYRIQRHSESKFHQESNVALYDRARDEVFVGDVFHDPERAAARRPFDPARDLPNIRASLGEAFGLPVRLRLGDQSRGTLKLLTVSIDQQRGAFATRTGFVSSDGATLMIGEFHSLSESPMAFRSRLLAQNPGIPASVSASSVLSRSAEQRSAAEHERSASRETHAFTVVEFLDFQCERCKKRTPEARLAAWERGGRIEIRLLPLAKMHDWAFAAAEAGAALAAIGPELFERYTEALFARQEKMNGAAVGELALDVAEASGA